MALFETTFTDDTVQHSSRGEFGLNTGILKSISYISGQARNKWEAFKIEVFSENDTSKPYIANYFFPDDANIQTFDRQLLRVGSDDWKRERDTQRKKINAILTHVLKAGGVKVEDIKAAYDKGFDSYKHQVFVLSNLFGSDPKPVDFFLQWSRTIPEGYTSNFLELPKNMFTGHFITPKTTPKGRWKAVTSVAGKPDGLYYIDDKNNIHPIQRDAKFMASNNAKHMMNNSSYKGSDATSAIHSDRNSYSSHSSSDVINTDDLPF